MSQDTIQFIKENGIEEDIDDPELKKIQGIVKNVQTYKGNMTFKQKWCLINFLVSEHEDYEIIDEDHPFY